AFIKRRSPTTLLRVRMRSGREITATRYHPLFALDAGELRPIRADELRRGIRVAVPRRLRTYGGPSEAPLTRSLDIFGEEDRVYVGMTPELIAWGRGARQAVGGSARWTRAAGVKPVYAAAFANRQALRVGALARLAALSPDPPPLGPT